MDTEFNDWFAREVLVFERSLSRYVAKVWPDYSEVADICQDAFVRVYEAVAKARPTSVRGLLFTTARHLMADRVRRGRIVSIEARGDVDALNVLIDECSPEQRVNARQELWWLAEAFARLPEGCRDVLWLTKVESLTRRQIAERLNITPKAVDKRTERGMRLLHEYFANATEVADAGSGKDSGNTELDHG